MTLLPALFSAGREYPVGLSPQAASLTFLINPARATLQNVASARLEQTREERLQSDLFFEALRRTL